MQKTTVEVRLTSGTVRRLQLESSPLRVAHATPDHAGNRHRHRTLPLLAVVELTGDADPGVRRRLLCAAYRASRNGPVILLLRGISPRTLGPILDQVVRGVGTDVMGVRYVDGDAALEWSDLMTTHTTVIAMTVMLRDMAVSRGCRMLSVERAIKEWGDKLEPVGGLPLQ